MTKRQTIRIPFNKAGLRGSELGEIQRAVARGHISGDGHYTRRCHAVLEGLVGASKALLTTSCTAALEMAAILLNVAPGDEIIMPSFTFVSTANAFVLRGAKPVFVDIRPDTLNLDEKLIERAISKRTRAIVVVHYGGVACEMDAIVRIARARRLPLIEDNAHGLFGRYKGRPLGSFGALATLSFHETKNVTCGEGGALLLNDPALIERAEIIREKGTDRSRFFRGQVDKYGWVDIGSSYLPSELLAAFLYAQLKDRRIIQGQRRAIWLRYRRELDSWAAAVGARLPEVPSHCEQAYHLFHMLMPTRAAREALINHLRALGILAVFHYLPLHLSRMGRRFGGKAGDCPVTESISERLVRLPFFNGLTALDQGAVITAVRRFMPAA